MINLEEAAPFQHRGATYYELNEYIYDADGKLIGLVSQRGTRYLWRAMREDMSVIAEGDGIMTIEDEHDPSMDAIIAAHDEVSEYTIDHTTDEFGEDRYFVADSRGDWVGDALPTRDMAAEVIRRLKEKS